MIALKDFRAVVVSHQELIQLRNIPSCDQERIFDAELHHIFKDQFITEGHLISQAVSLNYERVIICNPTDVEPVQTAIYNRLSLLKNISEDRCGLEEFNAHIKSLISQVMRSDPVLSEVEIIQADHVIANQTDSFGDKDYYFTVDPDYDHSKRVTSRMTQASSVMLFSLLIECDVFPLPRKYTPFNDILTTLTGVNKKYIADYMRETVSECLKNGFKQGKIGYTPVENLRTLLKKMTDTFELACHEEFGDTLSTREEE